MIEIYTDGACEPNPGFGGWAWACRECGETDSGDPGKITTNNEMEMFAVLKAIEHGKVEHPGEVIQIFSDSKYCVNGFNEWSHNWAGRGWKKKDKSVIKNLALWKDLYSLNNNVVLEWVKGHAGNEYNETVDTLAIAAMPTEKLTDQSLLNFGKAHRGKKLANVPASYLIYIFEKGWIGHYRSLDNYITENMEDLKQEAALEKEER